MPRSVTVQREISASINGFSVDGQDIIVTKLEFDLGGLHFKLERMESNVIQLTAHKGTGKMLDESVCWAAITETSPGYVQVRWIDKDTSTPPTREFKDGEPYEPTTTEQAAAATQ